MDMRFQQALMQLIQDGCYYSWSLPPGCTIVLTCNPDDGDYITNAQDLAMSGRYCKFGTMFDIGNWTDWATTQGIDGRCINILINGYREMLYAKDPTKGVLLHKMDVSPRDWSNFFRFISNLKDFSSPESLSIINRYGKAFVGDAIIQFTTALTQKMDMLPSPEEILGKTEKEVTTMLYNTCGSQKEKNGDHRYRPEIAATVSMRLQYFILNELRDKPLDKELADRIEFIMESPSFGNELKMAMVNLLYKADSAKMSTLITRPAIKDHLLATL